MNTKLLAFCLGDGTIGKGYMLHIRHCAAQKEYIEWKSKEISEIFPCSSPVYTKNGPYDAYSIHTKTNKQNEAPLVEIHRLLYEEYNRKCFSQTIVDAMDSYCFAVLYMDDGSLTAKRRNGKVHAYDLTISIYGDIEECNRIITKLGNYGMKFTIKRNKGKFSIRCGTKSARKFLRFIEESNPHLDCFKTTKFKDLTTNFTKFT